MSYTKRILLQIGQRKRKRKPPRTSYVKTKPSLSIRGGKSDCRLLSLCFLYETPKGRVHGGKKRGHRKNATSSMEEKTQKTIQKSSPL